MAARAERFACPKTLPELEPCCWVAVDVSGWEEQLLEPSGSLDATSGVSKGCFGTVGCWKTKDWKPVRDLKVANNGHSLQVTNDMSLSSDVAADFGSLFIVFEWFSNPWWFKIFFFGKTRISIDFS